MILLHHQSVHGDVETEGVSQNPTTVSLCFLLKTIFTIADKVEVWARTFTAIRREAARLEARI